MLTSEVADVRRAADLVVAGCGVVLTGAGISTESGIPDYRGRSGAMLRRHSPMTHQAFVADPAARRRYWARSHLGWGLMAAARPNAGHRAVAQLEQRGLVRGVITQNVDGLHTSAGSRRVVDLHGRLDRVVCLDCRSTSSRARLAARLSEANGSWQARVTQVNPDGDVDIADEILDGFAVVDCEACGGTLMPDVVYFGGTVPSERVAEGFELVDSASVVLVLGSSLTVFSGRRFVLRAVRSAVPVVIINEGPTRCDEHAALKIDAPLGRTLTELVDTVVAHPAASTAPLEGTGRWQDDLAP